MSMSLKNNEIVSFFFWQKVKTGPTDPNTIQGLMLNIFGVKCDLVMFSDAQVSEMMTLNQLKFIFHPKNLRK